MDGTQDGEETLPKRWCSLFAQHAYEATIASPETGAVVGFSIWFASTCVIQ